MNKFLLLFMFYLLGFNVLATKILNTNRVLLLPGCVAPDVPTGLKAITISTSKINLIWVDNSTIEEGYTVERSSVSATAGFAVIATLGSNATTFTSTALAANKTYWYRVRAFCSTSFSAYSNVAASITIALDVINISKPEIKTGKVYQTVNMASGAYFINHIDLFVAAQSRPLKWQRYYNSRLANLSRAMGFGWSHSYDYTLTNIGDSLFKVHYADGHESPWSAD